MRKIRLGDKVECKYSGLVGIAVARVEFINKCVQFEVQPRIDKEGKYVDAVSIDEHSLILLKPDKKAVKKPVKRKATGGPSMKSLSMKGW